MFEGEDDDFSFIDEDFLNDALEPSESRPSVSKVHKSSSEQQCTSAEKPFNENLPKENVKDSPFNSTHTNKCGLLADNVKYNANNQSRVRQSEIINNKSKSIENGEFDDFFDSFESEDYTALDVQSTPQDTEFTGVPLDNQPSNAQCEQIENVRPTENAKCDRKLDFRSRILQTLKEGRSSSITKNEEKESEPLNGVSVNSFSLAESERKRRADIPAEAVKKKIQVFNFDEADALLDSQSSSIVSTPFVPSPAVVRKSLSPAGPVVQKRKFPGPAGILPQLGAKTSLPTVQQLQENEQSPSDSKEVVCSQSSAEDFSRGPWQQMVNDLEEDTLFNASPLNVFNIKWVLRRADLRGQAGVRKIPFLAVMVRNIDTSFLDATVLLRDHTGEMSGTISSTVFEDYSHCLHSGCVLLLKDVTLLSPVSLKAPVGGREPTRRHYLNVTPNTILTIYSSDESGHVITTIVCEVNKKEMFDRAAAMKKAIAPRAIVEEEEEEEEPVHKENQDLLFSNVSKPYGVPIVHQNKNTANSNYRMPGSAFSPAGTSTQKQPVRFCPPVNSISRVGGPSTAFAPRIRIPNVNGIMRPLRPSSPYQQSPVTKPQSSFRPVLQQFSGALSTQNRNAINKPQTIQANATVFSSQQEEKEVSDLLEGVDEDSLFGDF